MSGEVSIDGSCGEGGGQILRTALALSAVTRKALEVGSIRANRPKPGLAAQHLAGIRLLAEVCGAEMSGAAVGSSTVCFSPGHVKAGSYTLDIGTAGSITLALQTVLPALASTPGEYRFTLTGGTDVKWSPPADYYNLVLFPLLERCGLECRLEIEARGYYPEGGGRAVTSISSPGRLKSMVLEPLSEVSGIRGTVNVSGLPAGIAERVRASALESLSPGLRGLADIRIESGEPGRSRGVGIVLAATDGQARVGASALGERGKPAEKVGIEVAEALMREIGGGGAVDAHASDQLLPYLAMAGGRFSARELTEHAETNVRTIEGFLGDVIEVENGGVVTFSAMHRGRTGPSSAFG